MSSASHPYCLYVERFKDLTPLRSALLSIVSSTCFSFDVPYKRLSGEIGGGHDDVDAPCSYFGHRPGELSDFPEVIRYWELVLEHFNQCGALLQLDHSLDLPVPFIERTFRNPVDQVEKEPEFDFNDFLTSMCFTDITDREMLFGGTSSAVLAAHPWSLAGHYLRLIEIYERAGPKDSDKDLYFFTVARIRLLNGLKARNAKDKSPAPSVRPYERLQLLRRTIRHADGLRFCAPDDATLEEAAKSAMSRKMLRRLLFGSSELPSDLPVGACKENECSGDGGGSQPKLKVGTNDMKAGSVEGSGPTATTKPLSSVENSHVHTGTNVKEPIEESECSEDEMTESEHSCKSEDDLSELPAQESPKKAVQRTTAQSTEKPAKVPARARNDRSLSKGPNNSNGFDPRRAIGLQTQKMTKEKLGDLNMLIGFITSGTPQKMSVALCEALRDGAFNLFAPEGFGCAPYPYSPVSLCTRSLFASHIGRATPSAPLHPSVERDYAASGLPASDKTLYGPLLRYHSVLVPVAEKIARFIVGLLDLGKMKNNGNLYPVVYFMTQSGLHDGDEVLLSLLWDIVSFEMSTDFEVRNYVTLTKPRSLRDRLQHVEELDFRSLKDPWSYFTYSEAVVLLQIKNAFPSQRSPAMDMVRARASRLKEPRWTQFWMRRRAHIALLLEGELKEKLLLSDELPTFLAPSTSKDFISEIRSSNPAELFTLIPGCQDLIKQFHKQGDLAAKLTLEQRSLPTVEYPAKLPNYDVPEFTVEVLTGYPENAKAWLVRDKSQSGSRTPSKDSTPLSGFQERSRVLSTASTSSDHGAPLNPFTSDLREACVAVRAGHRKTSVEYLSKLTKNTGFTDNADVKSVVAAYLCLAHALLTADNFTTGEIDEAEHAISRAEECAGEMPFLLVYILKAKAAVCRHESEESRKQLNSLELNLKSGTTFPTLPYPDGKGVLPISDRPGIEKEFNDLTMRLQVPMKPDLRCANLKCSNRNIYFDFGFKGYDKLECSERCVLYYHADCLKGIIMEFCAISEPREIQLKDVPCITPDCGGVFTGVYIYQADRKLKTQFENAKAKSRRADGAETKKPKKKQERHENNNNEPKRRRNRSKKKSESASAPVQQSAGVPVVEADSIFARPDNLDAIVETSIMDDLDLEDQSGLRKLRRDDDEIANQFGPPGAKKKQQRKKKKDTTATTFVMGAASYTKSRLEPARVESPKKTVQLNPAVQGAIKWLSKKLSETKDGFMFYDDPLVLSFIGSHMDFSEAIDQFGGIQNLLRTQKDLFSCSELGFALPGSTGADVSQNDAQYGFFDSSLAGPSGFTGKEPAKEPEFTFVPKPTDSTNLPPGLPLPPRSGTIRQTTEAVSGSPSVDGSFRSVSIGTSAEGGDLSSKPKMKFKVTKINLKRPQATAAEADSHSTEPESTENKAAKREKKKSAIIKSIFDRFQGKYTRDEIWRFVVGYFKDTGERSAGLTVEDISDKVTEFIWGKQTRTICPICLDPIQPTSPDLTRTRCDHLFHTACLDRWTAQNSVCPICRKYLVDESQFPALAK